MFGSRRQLTPMGKFPWAVVVLCWGALADASCRKNPTKTPTKASTQASAPTSGSAGPGTPAPKTPRSSTTKDSKVSLHGAPLKGMPLVPLSTLVDAPETYADKTIGVQAQVRRACTRKGCWMELAATKEAPGVRVRFKDYGFFVPLDAAGASAKVEGVVQVARPSEEIAAHLASEGATVPRGTDGKPREVQIIATGVELRRFH